MSSQGREDAILARVFAAIGPQTRYAVECGARDGVKGSNTHALHAQGWERLLLDAVPQSRAVRRVFLTAKNIAPTFRLYRVPTDFDLLSIDVDGNDWYLWRAVLLKGYRPRVVVIEYNSHFPPTESRVMPYQATHRWDKTTYYGASARALVKLAAEFRYSLVDYTPQNLIFVRDADLGPLTPCAELPPVHAFGYPAGPSRPWVEY